MTHQEIRKKFLNFFSTRGHVIVPSSSLLPTDPSVLFTTAGMQQFKPYYTGEADAIKDFGSLNTASIQKSMRTSDIDEVWDESHLTFFEMMGNFSFGGYFKKEAIQYAYDFVTKEMGLEIDYVSIFGGENGVPADEESEKIWQTVARNNGEKIEIKKMGRKDNFWGPTGDEGPCGPTTEIYVDGVEIWNIVFNEYYCDKDGTLKKLETAGVDTGMGLERLAMVVQGKKNIFETDLLEPILKLVPPELELETKRIIADHSRAIAFLITDGVRPSNKEQGYILRRLMRRVITYFYITKADSTVMHDIFAKIVEIHTSKSSLNSTEFLWPAKARPGNHSEKVFKDDFVGRDTSELNADLIINEFDREKEKFEKTLKQGIKELERAKSIDAQSAFRLYESFGLPYEVIKEFGGEKAVLLNREDFDEEFRKHQEISRAGAKKKFGGHGIIVPLPNLSYVETQGQATEGTEDVSTGRQYRHGDEGKRDKGIKDGSTQWQYRHGDEKATRLHTATHLLHASLRKILGEEVKQQGSDITPERLRFDFTFPRKLMPEELQQVEDMVNDAVKKELPVIKTEMSYEDAIRSGALAFFKQKYPERVIVYTIGPNNSMNGSVDGSIEPFSRELCGGPHVSNTREIGKFKIIKEEAISSGIRRIRAVVEK